MPLTKIVHYFDLLRGKVLCRPGNYVSSNEMHAVTCRRCLLLRAITPFAARPTCETVATVKEKA